MNQEIINALAESVKEAFVNKAKKIMPWYRYKSKDSTAFLKAAEICSKINADPTLFVDAQFVGVTDLSHFQVNYLYAAHAEQKYKDYVNENFIEQTPIDYEGLYQAQLSYLRQMIQSSMPVEKALLKDYVNFKPWFRILITKEPNFEIIKKYKPQIKSMSPDLFNFLNKKKLFDMTRLL